MVFRPPNEVGLRQDQLQNSSLAIVVVDEAGLRQGIRCENRCVDCGWGFHAETADLPWVTAGLLSLKVER